MPSIAELQSIATMEAMASGRPVVAANAMALPHLVHDGDNGYLFEPDNVQEFAQKLELILTADQKELDRLSENSLYLIQSHDIERTITIFEGLYRGDAESDRTSDDNQDSYSRVIGVLPESMQKRVLEFRERARALREAASERSEDLREEVRDRLEDLRDEVVERTKAVNTKVKETAKNTAQRAKKVVRDATDRLKNDEE
jgi:hypothetical protein